jgi:hypothetical protein
LVDRPAWSFVVVRVHRSAPDGWWMAPLEQSHHEPAIPPRIKRGRPRFSRNSADLPVPRETASESRNLATRALRSGPNRGSVSTRVTNSETFDTRRTV